MKRMDDGVIVKNSQLSLRHGLSILILNWFFHWYHFIHSWFHIFCYHDHQYQRCIAFLCNFPFILWFRLLEAYNSIEVLIHYCIHFYCLLVAVTITNLLCMILVSVPNVPHQPLLNFSWELQTKKKNDEANGGGGAVMRCQAVRCGSEKKRNKEKNVGICFLCSISSTIVPPSNKTLLSAIEIVAMTTTHRRQPKKYLFKYASWL